MRRKQFIHRNRRSAAEEVDDVLKEIAAEEIDEVDIIMEDINDEINDLQDSIDEKDSPCSISQNQVINFLSFLPKFPTASSCFFTRSGMNFFAQKMNFTVFYLVKKYIYPKKR